MPSSQESPSYPKRPTVIARTSSTSSAAALLSPTEPNHQHRAHKPQKHVVGHVRVSQRNSSFGKNLNKLSKQTAAHGGGEAAGHTKNHRRVHSGSSTPTESSRPHVKRNASSVGIVRHNPQAPIRKNHSSGHLSRASSSKNMLKSSKTEVAATKRSLMKPDKSSRPSSRDADHPTVHFDIGDEEDGPDEEWTEESASQSPNTTRSNTRSNSVVLDQNAASDLKRRQGAATPVETTSPLKPSASRSQPLTRKNTDPHEINGASSYTPSKPPDADVITSRLLRRNVSHNLPPQMSSISATALSESHDTRNYSQSQGSTLAETPGRDLVSRFMDGDGSAGTPKDRSFLPPPQTNTSKSSGTLDETKRIQSTPNMAATAAGSSQTSRLNRNNPRRSGANTPTNDLNPSRTQQKLWLQRASSNVEPQKLIPIILPRTGGPQLLGPGATYTATGEGRIDPRLQRQFDQVALEYKVVRRYRSPLADALVRIEKLPAGVRKSYTPRSTKSRGSGDGRRSRDGFEAREEGDGEVQGRGSLDSEGGRGAPRSEAEEICRRLWESTEVLEGED